MNLTYQELDRRARAIAVELQAIVPPGSRAVLLYHCSLQYIQAFFGCLYANVIAVPAYPLHRGRVDPPVLALLKDCQAAAVLTSKSLLEQIRFHTDKTPELAGLRWVATDEIPDHFAQDWRELSVQPETVAFLQYTSGSTGNPKGVMISHANLLHNEGMIQRAFGQTEQDLVVGWLPLFHDMGLIGNVLHSLYLGVRCILMPPVAFLQRPYRWLQAISRYRATTSGAPNFAYDLCVRKITEEQTASLDLSCWQVAFTGAEPVRAETLERFADKFAPCGFHREAFYPCYGLAEATLFVSGGARNAGPRIYAVRQDSLERGCVDSRGNDSSTARRLVGCGWTWDTQRVAIVDCESFRRCNDGEVGEIWVSGPSIAQGYWKRPEETQNTFQAYVEGTNEGPFLRTGDLGFVQGGELFVTGRLNDLIIIRGRNYYPEDIERLVQDSHPALEEGRGAVFCIDDQRELRLIVTQEVKYTHRHNLNVAEVIGNIREALARDFGIDAFAIVLLKSGGIQRTSSGKIRRQSCRARFLQNDLELFQ